MFAAEKKIHSEVRTAVDAATGRRMPAELCGLVADYAVDMPHTFTAVDVSVDVVAEEDGRRTTFIAKQTMYLRWKTFVSAQPFASSNLEWTVDFGIDTTSRTVWIGVGVTSRPWIGIAESANLSFSTMSSQQDWLLFPNRYSNCINKSHGGQLMPTDYANSLPAENMSNKYRFAFVADPVGGVIRCRVLQADKNGKWLNLNDGPPITLLTASTAKPSYSSAAAAADNAVDNERPAFGSLRPCVVIGGLQQAVFRSGPFLSADV
jgi:hypothetical protein